MEIGRGVYIGTATNRSNGVLQLPSFSYVLTRKVGWERLGGGSKEIEAGEGGRLQREYLKYTSISTSQ